MRPSTYNQDAVRVAILELSVDGAMPTMAQYEKHRKAHGLPSYKSVFVRWGSFASIANELGLHHSTQTKWTKQRAIQEGIRLSNGEYIVTKLDWNYKKPAGAPSMSTINLWFGSWNGFAEACGLLPNKRTEVFAEGCDQCEIFKPKPMPEPTFINPDFFRDNFVPICQNAS